MTLPSDSKKKKKKEKKQLLERMSMGMHWLDKLIFKKERGKNWLTNSVMMSGKKLTKIFSSCEDDWEFSMKVKEVSGWRRDILNNSPS